MARATRISGVPLCLPGETLMASSPNRVYLPQVDHLRAYAAALIIFYHGLQLFGSPLTRGEPFAPSHWLSTRNPLLALLVEGHTAVSMFIVLSGFIFTYGVLGKTLSYGRVPAQQTAADLSTLRVPDRCGGVCAPGGLQPARLGAGHSPSGQSPGHPERRLDHLHVLDNIRRASVLFDIPTALAFVSEEWSLVSCLDGCGRDRVRLLGANVRDLAYWTIVGRLDQFIIGMLAAWAVLHADASGRRLERWLPITSAGVLGVLFVFHRAGGWPAEAVWKAAWPTVEGVAWATVIGTYLDAAKRLPDALSRAIAAVGARSYSMYLLLHDH